MTLKNLARTKLCAHLAGYLLISVAFIVCANSKGTKATFAPEVEEGFIGNEILVVVGSGTSGVGIKTEPEKEKRAQLAAKLDAQRSFRENCRIGMDTQPDFGPGPKSCFDASLHTAEIKAAVQAALKTPDLIKISCKNESDATKTCRAYYKFTMPDLKPLCERAARLAMAMCG